jgi:hypothetical protein
MRPTHVDNKLIDFLRRELDLKTDREVAQILQL